MSVNKELIRDWITKAGYDLKSASVLLNSEEELYGTVCFHAQQAAEKALKALLTARDIEFAKTHNLLFLSDVLNDEQITEYNEALDRLTDHAVETRYPGDYVEPERQKRKTLCVLLPKYFNSSRKSLGKMIWVSPNYEHSPRRGHHMAHASAVLQGPAQK